MKNILITGTNSYIGTSFENWLEREPSKYKVETLNMRDRSWKTEDFSRFDVVFHVAGIVHTKETKKNIFRFYSVNRDLTIELANILKSSGVPHFVFVSTMSVYNNKETIITNTTLTNPSTHYGISKLQAENYLKNIESKNFRVTILRPPMIYGKNCKGNYNKLRNFVLKYKIFPNYKCKKSMIFIGNLSIFSKYIIDNEVYGILHPQNSEYVETVEMVKEIAKYYDSKIIYTKFFNLLIYIFINFIKLNIFKKIFSSLIYKFDNENQIYKKLDLFTFTETIGLTEGGLYEK